jgi:hypothetical protein
MALNRVMTVFGDTREKGRGQRNVFFKKSFGGLSVYGLVSLLGLDGSFSVAVGCACSGVA